MIEKTILVTGSNGLLGQKLVDKLANRSAVQLVATSRGPNRNPKTDGYAYESLDIMDEARMRELFEVYQPTELINCAAMTHVDKCEQDKEGCWNLNVKAVEIMVRVCRDFGTKIIHISTDFIFDGEAGPYKEKDEPNPLSYYGRSKLEGERIVRESGLPFAIGRTMLVYGVVADMSRSNIVLWAKGALAKGQEINVVNDQFRSPTLAEDLAEGVIQLAMRERVGIYHLSGPEVLSIVEMVRQVAEHWGLDKELIKEISSETLGQAAKRPPKTGFVILKAQTELSYKPRSFRDGLSVVERQLLDYAR